jgi:hypothetical protein
MSNSVHIWENGTTLSSREDIQMEDVDVKRSEGCENKCDSE